MQPQTINQMKSKMNEIAGLLVMLASIFSMALSQQMSADKVPAIVRQSCEAKFPGVRKVAGD
jgi:hypothetical protein